MALIGYAFGADIMPFTYDRLPLLERQMVTMMPLLGFAMAPDLEIHVTGWLGMPATSPSLPVMPEIIRVTPALIQCFYGENEADTVCPQLTRLHVAVIRTLGSHHFDGHYEQLAQVILNGRRRRLTAGWPVGRARHRGLQQGLHCSIFRRHSTRGDAMTIFILAILAFAVGLILDVTALLCLIGELISQYVIIASVTGLFVVTWISGHLWTRDRWAVRAHHHQTKPFAEGCAG